MADAHQTVVPERRRHQQPRAPLPGELRDGWLAFESQTERRRFTPPPPDWSEMSDDELAALLDQSVPAGKARRLIE